MAPENEWESPMQLSDSANAALIAGVVSLVISVVSTYLTARYARQRFKSEVAEKYRQKLYELRLEAYPTAFAITGRVVFDDALRSTPEELGAVLRDLRNWWVGPAAPLLSKHSVKAYYTLEDLLKTFSSSGDDCPSPNRLYDANRAFRLALRQDLDVLYNDDEFSDSLRRGEPG